MGRVAAYRCLQSESSECPANVQSVLLNPLMAEDVALWQRNDEAPWFRFKELVGSISPIMLPHLTDGILHDVLRELLRTDVTPGWMQSTMPPWQRSLFARTNEEAETRPAPSFITPIFEPGEGSFHVDGSSVKVVVDGSFSLSVSHETDVVRVVTAKPVQVFLVTLIGDTADRVEDICQQFSDHLYSASDAIFMWCEPNARTHMTVTEAAHLMTLTDAHLFDFAVANRLGCMRLGSSSRSLSTFPLPSGTLLDVAHEPYLQSLPALSDELNAEMAALGTIPAFPDKPISPASDLPDQPDSTSPYPYAARPAFRDLALFQSMLAVRLGVSFNVPAAIKSLSLLVYGKLGVAYVGTWGEEIQALASAIPGPFRSRWNERVLVVAGQLSVSAAERALKRMLIRYPEDLKEFARMSAWSALPGRIRALLDASQAGPNPIPLTTKLSACILYLPPGAKQIKPKSSGQTIRLHADGKLHWALLPMGSIDGSAVNSTALRKNALLVAHPMLEFLNDMVKHFASYKKNLVPFAFIDDGRFHVYKIVSSQQ